MTNDRTPISGKMSEMEYCQKQIFDVLGPAALTKIDLVLLEDDCIAFVSLMISYPPFHCRVFPLDDQRL